MVAIIWWMLVADKVGGALWLHKVERFNAAGGIAGFQNIFQQAGGAFLAQRFHQHGAQIFVGVDIQRGKLFCFLLKLASTSVNCLLEIWRTFAIAVLSA
jgi:hypothetical protein